MQYATVDDMLRRFGEQELIQLTDVAHIPPSAIDAARIEIKLADAAAFADGYIGHVYRLPLRGCAKPAITPGGAAEYVVPPVLTRITCDVARYYLHDDLAPEHEVYRRYQAAVKDLEAIAAGEMTLACPWGGTAGDPVAAASDDEVSYAFADRAIGDDVTRSYA